MRQSPPGERATFEDLYAEHAPRVASLLWWLRVAPREQPDVAQEVWLHVHQGLASYDASQGTERAWILGIARNVARDWHRTQRRRPELLTITDQEPAGELPTSEAEAAKEEQRQALWAFFARAVPNADHREAFLLHELGGLTVQEVAKQTGVRFWTAQWRLKMARSKLKEAQEALSDEERERLRAVVLPLGTVDALIEAMRAPVSDRQIEQVWDRVSEQIEREGGRTDAPLGGHSTTPPLAAPPGYLLTGAQLGGGIAGIFVAGFLAGAGALYAFASHNGAREAPIARVEEAPPTPAPTTPEPAPEPAPSARAAPKVVRSAVWESEALLNRARRALQSSPAQALTLADEHARRFQGSSAAEREEIAIRALVRLGQRTEAEARAAQLVQWAPSKRPTMETVIGRSLF